MCTDCTGALALAAAMCTFVTLSEKRGIVYSEHMLVTAAVMEARCEHGNLDQSGSAVGCPRS